MAPTCSVEGCERESVAHSWCDAHYARWRKYGDVRADTPIRERRRITTSRPLISKDGYCYVPAEGHPNANANGLILEHRLVVSRDLGRPLTAQETVHHKNGIRSDNRLSNLELRAGPHGPGQDVNDLVAYSVDLLAEYAPALLAEFVEPDLSDYQRELEIEMNRFRGRLLGLLESFGLDESQERGCKSTLKSLSYDMQAALASVIDDSAST